MLKEKLRWVDAVAFALIFSGVAVSLAKPASSSSSSSSAEAPAPQVALAPLPAAPAPERALVQLEPPGAGRRLLASGGSGSLKQALQKLGSLQLGSLQGPSSSGHEAVELLQDESSTAQLMAAGAHASSLRQRTTSAEEQAAATDEEQPPPPIQQAHTQ